MSDVVGGRVVETVDCGDMVRINTVGPCGKRETYLERTSASRSISEGDEVWWQDGPAYWTPHVIWASGEPTFADMQLLRIPEIEPAE